MTSKEYRVIAHFTKVYEPRSYKRKIVTTREEAEKLLKVAKKYYSSYNYFDHVSIESREVTNWEEI